MAQHVTHPSLAELKRKKSAQIAKDQFLERVSSEHDSSDREHDVVASSIENERLKKFTYSGDKYFKILVDSIQIYKNKSLQIQNDNPDIHFDRNDIVQGTYVDNKKVLFGTPYNVYCNATDVEPIDIDHKAYLHKHKEQEMKKQKNTQKNNNDANTVAIEDAAGNESDIDAEFAERTRLIDADKQQQKDPSLSDYTSVGLANDNKHQKGYSMVEDGSDNDGDGPLIIMKRTAWYKRYPYHQCVGFLLFLCILILDILLIVFLSNLNATKNAMDIGVCDEEELMLIYDVEYMAVTVINLINLIIFCMLLYFKPQIVKRSMGIWILNGMSVMMIAVYLSLSLYQMMRMSKDINAGINGVSDDIQCNVGVNTAYIEDMKDGYDAVNTVTVLKVFQGVCLCIVGCSIMFMRSIGQKL